MTGARAQTGGAWRHVLLTLAVLALFVRIVVPAGFMPDRAQPGAPVSLVLCTGYGEVTVQVPGQVPGEKAPPARGGHDAPCAFAGLAAAAPPPALLDAGAAQVFAHAVPAPVPAPPVSPGRGLSGPPLPARGPPALLI